MDLSEHDLEQCLNGLRAISLQGEKAIQTIDKEFEDISGWLSSVNDGLKNGTINVQSVLVPKTPGKRQAPLTNINESLETSIDLEENIRSTRSSNRVTRNTRASKKEQTRRPGPKSKKAPMIEVLLESDDETKESPQKSKNERNHQTEENEETLISHAGKTHKRHSEEPMETTAKRMCGNSATTSRDSGLSSVGSRITRGSTLNGAIVKLEILTPKNMSVESSSSVALKEEQFSLVSNDGSAETTPVQSPHAVESTLVPDSVPEILTPDKCSHSATAKSSQPQLLKGDSVKKTVKAFEALNDVHGSETISTSMAPPQMPPPSKPAVSKTLSTSVLPLEAALSAPSRVTRTKTRAMAKAAAADEEKKDKAGQKDEQLPDASRMFKSPIKQIQQQQTIPSQHKTLPSIKVFEKRAEDYHEKENTATSSSSSKIVLKPFGSASKQPTLFLKSSTPMNRINPLATCTPGSLSAPRNLVTSVDSFIMKPVVHHEIKSSREENLQKLVSKAEFASKKKEEIMKAQIEERIKKRQEKRLKVCAAREAMEKEKLEMHLKLEREREEKQRQLQAEREEKLRQEYLKKKRLAQQKAAETEERRRQEEATRLAKLKQQEEEQRRIAAQRKKEQEDAERKQLERIQQEREAAAFRAMEAERLAKEANLKAKKAPKPLLDQTYDKLPQAPHSYGTPPTSAERPEPPANPESYGIEDANTDDSSEDESKPKKAVPLWAQPKYRLPKLLDDYEINHPQMFAFFGSQKSTPDLSKIFTAIDRRQLIRKSSAVWRTPPVKN